MNKKIVVLLVLTFCIIIPSCTFAFSDVEGHWAEETINDLSKYGIINGYTDNTFRPDDYMTRAELITLIDNLLDIESETDSYISDVTSKDWYNNNIRKGIYFGIIKGDNKGKVNPNNRVTREETIVIISRALKITPDNVVLSTSYSDANKVSEWAQKEYSTFIRKQYIKGYNDNTLRPRRSITRAEILTILNRIINNIIPSSYSIKMNGNTLIKDRDVIINNAEFFGNLIIGERASKTIKLTNVVVHGDIVLYAPIDTKTNTISVDNKIVNAYEDKGVSDDYYTNKEYGITFPIPKGVNVFDDVPEDSKDFSKKDLIIVRTEVNDELYYKDFSTAVKESIKKLEYDSIFEKIDEGEIQKYPYELYKDNINTILLVIKRDNVMYNILFMNIASKNIVDNIVSNIIFTDGTKIINHENVIYKNSKLALKFAYKKGYVGVDDSYNTNIVYSGDSIFKLFIQVNMITDMDNYSIEQIKTLLRSLIKNDGEIVSEEVLSVSNHNAIKFEIDSGSDRIISLYVIIGNNLYNFIFRGDRVKVESLGKDMFNNIVNSMEF